GLSAAVFLQIFLRLADQPLALIFPDTLDFAGLVGPAQAWIIEQGLQIAAQLVAGSGALFGFGALQLALLGGGLAAAGIRLQRQGRGIAQLATGWRRGLHADLLVGDPGRGE